MSAVLEPTDAPEVPDILLAGTLSVKGVFEEYGLKRQHLYNLMASGKLTYTQVGRRRLIPRRAVLSLLAQGLVTATDE